jgi:Serine acetyltransferase, N-terminal
MVFSSRHWVMRESRATLRSVSSPNIYTLNQTEFDLSVDDLWQASFGSSSNPYKSSLFASALEWEEFMDTLREQSVNGAFVDPFWEQIKLEAIAALELEPEAGPQLYQGILSQPSFLAAICTAICHQIETELIPATEVKNLFLQMLTPEDEYAIRLDLIAVVSRSASVRTAMSASE